MAVDVTRMMASRGLTIPGSGTVATRTSCLPCQVNARIEVSSVKGDARGLVDRRASGCVGATGYVGVHPRGGDLAGFHELLEAPQVAACLNLWLALEQPGDQLADGAGRRVVGDCRGHQRAASAGRIAKVDPATVRHVGPGRGFPADQLVRNILDDHRVPLDCGTRRGAHDPMRTALVELGDALDVLQYPGEVAEVSPERVQLVARSADRHRSSNEFL